MILHLVYFIYKATSCCIIYSKTSYFYVCDADAVIQENFQFKFEPSDRREAYPGVPETECVFTYRSHNPINDLIYGYGGVKLFPKKNLLAVNEFKVDMTTSIGAKFVPKFEVANTTAFNTDPFNTWRSAFRECTKLSSNIIDHNNVPTSSLSVSITSQNPSCPTCNDGYAFASANSGILPYLYNWSNGVTGAFNANLGVGTYIIFVSDAVGSTASATVTLTSTTAPITGCTDPLATNYDPLATVDDGSCSYTVSCSSPSITGLGVSNVIHDRVTLTFDDMNSSSCRVDQLRIKYREVGTNAWSQKNMGSPTGYDPVTGICNSTSRTDKLLLGLSSNTTYEWQMRVWYCSTGNTPWVNGPNFTTLADCPNVGNLAVTTPNSTKATFTWDNSNGAYSFVRLQGRVDTTGSSFFNIGGVGVQYGTYTKNKNGLVPGTTYRAKSRTWCDPNGGAYKAPSWTSFIYFTMPGSVRLEESSVVNDLDIYPNPSRDVFNISFRTANKQDITLRIRNIIGEEIYTEDLNQFDGAYTKAISLENYPKAVYFLEIYTIQGTINKKLILQ